MDRRRLLASAYGFAIGLAACLYAANAAAQETSLRFKGQILDGPLEGYAFTGRCGLDAGGDPLAQRVRCSLVARGPDDHRFSLVDSRAHVGVVGEGRVVQITIGLDARTAGAKGNNKLVAFASTVFFHREVSLDRPFPPLVAASVSLLGGTVTSGSDCLIYDILGPN